MEEVCRVANAHDFISELPKGYDTLIGEGGVQLSGGQKQRIAIARALARNPKILLLDEATSALDTESEQIVQRAIEQASAGRTTISIAHRLSTIRNSDKIMVFDHGRIVETGTHKELLDLGKIYFQLVRAQEIDNVKNEETGTDEDWKEDEEAQKIVHSVRSTSITSSDFAQMSGRTKRLSTRVSTQEQALSKVNDQDKLHAAEMSAIYYTLLGVYAGISTFVGGYLFSVAGERITRRLRIKLFTHYLRQNGEYFDSLDHASGKLITRLAVDAPNIRAAVDQRLAEVVQSASALTSGLIIAFVFGPKMAVIEIVTSLSLVISQIIATQYLKIRTTQDSKIAEEPSRLASEAIQQYKTVQYLTREQFFYDEYKRKMRPLHFRIFIRSVVEALTYSLTMSFELLNFACAYRFGIWLIGTNNATPYVVFQVIEAMNNASLSMLSFGPYIPELVRAQASAGIIFSMLEETPKIDSVSEKGKKPVLVGDVCLKQVCFAYPGNKRRLVLRGINIEALNGQTVAIVGPSGCGKSTIVQLLERFYDPLDGQILFDDSECRSINLRHLRSQIALVGQEPTLFSASIKDNIAYGVGDVSMEDVVEAAKLANAHNFIMEMAQGYDTHVGGKGGKLSGGQKQRIAIARAIIRKPKILLLDEATSALDSESEKVVQEALDRARHGRTSIIIAHRLSSIQNSDRIVVMKKGEIIEQGTHKDLLNSNNLYARLVRSQNLS